MENASKALLMAASILIGILILSLIVTLFASARDVSSSYENEKKAEAVQRFNANFTKYLGQNLTIHQVVTICNFADINNNKVQQVTVIGGYTKNDIQEIVNSYTNGEDGVQTYTLKIEEYSEEGYVKTISFN